MSHAAAEDLDRIVADGFRDALVHADLDLDPERVWTVLQRAPDRFERFAREFAAWLSSR